MFKTAPTKQMNMLRTLFLLSAILLSSASRAQSTVNITIKNIRNAKGVCCVALFSNPTAFPGQLNKATKSVVVRATKGNAKVKFDNVPSGTYAIAVIHDENEDGQLNTNFLGIPKEGYGASNNRLPITCAPDFTGASFIVTAKVKDLDINLKYLL